MINIRKLKEQLTLEDYELIFLELEIPITNKNSNYWQLKSACHNIDVNDGDSNLIFYLDTKSFKCFSHGCLNGQDIFDLILTRKRLLGECVNFVDAINFVIDCSNIDIRTVTRKTVKTNEFNTLKFIQKHLNKSCDEIELSVLNEKTLTNFDKFYHECWLNDGINEKTLDKFEILWYNYRQQIVIPVRDDEGKLVGIRARNMLPDIPKYIPVKMLNGTEYNFPSSAVLYGLYQNIEGIRKEKRVVLLESEKSVMQLDSMGYNFGVAMFGLSLSKYQVNLLNNLGVEEVIIAIDKDYYYTDSKEYKEFESRVNKFIKRLQGYFKLSIIVDRYGLLDYKDSPTDKGKKVFDELLERRELI